MSSLEETNISSLFILLPLLLLLLLGSRKVVIMRGKQLRRCVVIVVRSQANCCRWHSPHCLFSPSSASDLVRMLCTERTFLYRQTDRQTGSRRDYLLGSHLLRDNEIDLNKTWHAGRQAAPLGHVDRRRHPLPFNNGAGTVKPGLFSK